MVDTLFSLAEAFLYMQLVEIKVGWGRGVRQGRGQAMVDTMFSLAEAFLCWWRSRWDGAGLGRRGLGGGLYTGV